MQTGAKGAYGRCRPRGKPVRKRSAVRILGTRVPALRRRRLRPSFRRPEPSFLSMPSSGGIRRTPDSPAKPAADDGTCGLATLARYNRRADGQSKPRRAGAHNEPHRTGEARRNEQHASPSRDACASIEALTRSARECRRHPCSVPPENARPARKRPKQRRQLGNEQ